jgi:YD repeat-containing protein
VLLRSIEPGQYLAIRYSERLEDAEAVQSVGRRIEATAGGVTETWGWDDAGRLTFHVDANGRTTSYGWDDTNSLTSILYPGQTVPLTRVSDEAGRLEVGDGLDRPADVLQV